MQKNSFYSSKVNWGFRENWGSSQIWRLYCNRLWELRATCGLANVIPPKDLKVVWINYGLLGLNVWSISPTVHITVRTVVKRTTTHSWTTQLTHHGVHYFRFTARWKLLLHTWKEKTVENQIKMTSYNACFCPPSEVDRAITWFIMIEGHCYQDGKILHRDKRFWCNKSDNNNNKSI